MGWFGDGLGPFMTQTVSCVFLFLICVFYVPTPPRPPPHPPPPQPPKTSFFCNNKDPPSPPTRILLLHIKNTKTKKKQESVWVMNGPKPSPNHPILCEDLRTVRGKVLVQSGPERVGLKGVNCPYTPHNDPIIIRNDPIMTPIRPQ